MAQIIDLTAKKISVPLNPKFAPETYEYEAINRNTHGKKFEAGKYITCITTKVEGMRLTEQADETLQATPFLIKLYNVDPQMIEKAHREEKKLYMDGYFKADKEGNDIFHAKWAMISKF